MTRSTDPAKYNSAGFCLKGHRARRSVLARSRKPWDTPQVAHLSHGDRLALALWWLIESVADELQMPAEQAADEVAMLCALGKEMIANHHQQ